MECPFGMVPVQGNFPVHHHGAQIRAKEKMFSDKDWKFKKKWRDIPSLKLTVRTWNRPFHAPKGSRIVFQPSIFRGGNVSFRVPDNTSRTMKLLRNGQLKRGIGNWPFTKHPSMKSCLFLGLCMSFWDGKNSKVTFDVMSGWNAFHAVKWNTMLSWSHKTVFQICEMNLVFSSSCLSAVSFKTTTTTIATELTDPSTPTPISPPTPRWL